MTYLSPQNVSSFVSTACRPPVRSDNHLSDCLTTWLPIFEKDSILPYFLWFCFTTGKILTDKSFHRSSGIGGKLVAIALMEGADLIALHLAQARRDAICDLFWFDSFWSLDCQIFFLSRSMDEMANLCDRFEPWIVGGSVESSYHDSNPLNCILRYSIKELLATYPRLEFFVVKEKQLHNYPPNSGWVRGKTWTIPTNTENSGEGSFVLVLY